VMGSVTFPTQTTFPIATTDDNFVESAESFTVQVSVANPSADMGTAFGTAASLSITDNDTAGLVLAPMPPAMLEVPEGGEARYTVRLATQPTMGTVTVTVSGGGSTVTFAPTTALTFTSTNWSAPQTVTVTAAMEAEIDDTATLAHAVSGSGEYANADSMLNASLTVTIIPPDDPAAREARVKTPLADIAGGIGQLTAQAVSQRLHFTGAATMSLAAGAAPGDLPDHGAFALAHNGSGINLWGTAAKLSANGNHNGVSYDADTTALHLGADTKWNDGLLGIAIAQGSGDADFTAHGIASTLKTSTVSVHPYLTRTAGQAELWATLGYGTGEAELRESEDAERRRGAADLALLSAAAGLALAVGDNAKVHLGGNWSRAELDAATLRDEADADRTYALPRTTASILRLTGGVEMGRQIGDWRPFVTVNLRRDSGDGDDGNAADYGGGVEWQNDTAHLRLAGRKHAQGKGPDEEHLTLTARKTAGPISLTVNTTGSSAALTARKTSGRLNLGLNLAVDNGIDTANLLTGELRF